MNFKFSINDVLRIKASGELGDVIGRAEYANTENGYLIRYKAGDGRATESWWGESALEEMHNAAQSTLRTQVAADGTTHIAGLGWGIASDGSVRIGEEEKEPTAVVTIPHLGTLTKYGRAHISVRAVIDGALYGADSVLEGKSKSAYSRRVRLIPMLTAP